MVEAHLSWAKAQGVGLIQRLPPLLDDEARRLVEAGVLATSWIPFRSLIQIDRAIAAVVGGAPERVFRELGLHSATANLAGAYKKFVTEEPHRFFAQMARLHERFQNFGRSVYERTGDRAGRMRVDGYEEYSPIFCVSGLGYYEGALRMMKVPGPVRGLEVSCQCAGHEACVFELSW